MDKINWENYFDKIYCIHYLPYTDRKERISNELDRVGILNLKNFQWKYTFDSPFYQNLLNSDIKLFHESLKNVKMLKCTLSHYEIYKEAQGLNLNRILILEDDIVFLKDLNEIINILNDMPNFDVILFDKIAPTPMYYQLLINNYKVNKNYAAFANALSSGGFYSLSKNAINFCINKQENGLHAADTAWHMENQNGDNISRCFSIKNLGYQKSYNNCYTAENMKNFNINDPVRFLYERNINLNIDEYN